MNTISPPMSVSQATDYYPGETGGELLEAFAADEIERTSFQVAKSEWGGEIAEKFGLKGAAVDPADFKKLLDGINPVDGRKLVRHRRQSNSPNKKENQKGSDPANETAADDVGQTEKPANGNQNETSQDQGRKKSAQSVKAEKTGEAAKAGTTAERRACLDATFSIPKSGSLAGIVGGDLRVIEAHRKAVSSGMSEIEKVAQARLGGNKPPQKTGKLIYASFEHYVARPDQQKGLATVDLHTHHTIKNFTFLENDKSYSLQPHSLYECQKLATAVYRLELARQLIAIGYELRLDEKTKAPEIAAISRAYIEAVSPRQAEIKAKAAELNITSTRSIAARYRAPKSEKSTDNIEIHRQIERQFDNQAGAAVRQSLDRPNCAQPEIIEALEAEVRTLRLQAAEKEAKRAAHYLNRQTERAAQQKTETLISENHISDAPPVERRTVETEASKLQIAEISVSTARVLEVNHSKIEITEVYPLESNDNEQSGIQREIRAVENQTVGKGLIDGLEKASRIIVGSGSERNGAIIVDRISGGRNRNFGRNINDGIGSGESVFSDEGGSFVGTEKTITVAFGISGAGEEGIERGIATGIQREIGGDRNENRHENSGGFRQSDKLGGENDFELKISGEKPSQSAKSNSSAESSARRRETGEDEAVEQPAAQKISPASQAVESVVPVTGDSTATEVDNLLRTDYDEQLESDEFRSKQIKLKHSNGTSGTGLLGSVPGDLLRREGVSEPIIFDEADGHFLSESDADSNSSVYSTDTVASDLSDTNILANDRRGDRGDYGDSFDAADLRRLDLQSRSGSGDGGFDNRVGSDLRSEFSLLDSESDFGRGSVQPVANERFNDGFQLAELAEFSDVGFSAEIAVPQPDLSESNSSAVAPAFAEIEQIFAAQSLQETLACQIVDRANGQSLQNRQIDINRDVRATMFARLMQMSAAAAAANDAQIEDAAASRNFGDDGLLKAIYQNSLTDDRSLDRFTDSVEDDHHRRAAEEAERLAIKNSRRDDDASAEIDEEEIENEEYEHAQERKLVLTIEL